MKRNRFKHQVHIFCHMFCGWQIVNDLERLIELESGTLLINVLKNESYFDDEKIEALTISDAIYEWFIRDISSHQIKETEIDEAYLIVEFKIQRIKEQKQVVHEYHCTGVLQSGDDRYIENFVDLNGKQTTTNTHQGAAHNERKRSS